METDTPEATFERRKCGRWINLSASFRLGVGKRDFQRQYYHLYRARLDAMRPRVERRARDLLPHGTIIRPLCQLGSDVRSDQDLLVIGTLCKNQKLKPNILKELSEENALLPQPTHTRYISDDDDLVLEDDLQRIRLRGNIDVSHLVTGIVCGVYGNIMESGKFQVKRIVFAEAPCQPERPIFPVDRFIILISGLELAESSTSTMSALQLAVDWINGEGGELIDQEQTALVERVVIAGNSLNEATKDRDEINRAKYLTHDTQAKSIEALKLLDKYIIQLLGSVDVDVMPGANDPANYVLPQQPFHPCLFPLAKGYPTLHTVSNPYVFDMDGLILFGTSGQNVTDIMRNANFDCPLDALEALLRWSHFSPTCPDTLGSFPYRDRDPFVIEKKPHVLFVGNQDHFKQRTIKDSSSEVLLIAIPKFAESKSVVSLNLRTLEAQEIQFCIEI